MPPPADPPMQQGTRIIAIRHGETAWNAQTRMQGQLDIPLNEVGRWQADRVAAALADEVIDALYASDLKRASQTAEPLARACGRPVVTDAGLRERCFGAFQGLTFDEVEQRWPEESLRWRRRDPDFAPEGAETLRAFARRCIETVAALAAIHAGGSIALVVHGGVLDSLYRNAAGVGLQSSRTWLLGNAGINRLLWTPQGFGLVGWSDMRHLDEAPLDDADEGEGAPPAVDRMGHAA